MGHIDLTEAIGALTRAGVTTSTTDDGGGTMLHLGEHRRVTYRWATSAITIGEAIDPATSTGADWKSQLAAGPVVYNEDTQRWHADLRHFSVGPHLVSLDSDQAPFWWPAPGATAEDILSYITARLDAATIGLTIIAPPDTFTTSRHVEALANDDGNPLTPLAHVDCPGDAAYLAYGWIAPNSSSATENPNGHQRYAPVYVCADYAAHGHTLCTPADAGTASTTQGA